MTTKAVVQGSNDLHKNKLRLLIVYVFTMMFFILLFFPERTADF